MFRPPLPAVAVAKWCARLFPISGFFPRRNPALGRNHMPFARDVLGHYTLTGAQTEEEILAAAEDILARRLYREATISDPRSMEQFLRMRLGHLSHEEFHICYLDNRHRVLGISKHASGTIDGCQLFPRMIVKEALCRFPETAAVVLVHNHPSGIPEPSQADKNITKTIVAALALIEIRVLDHLIVTAGECVSFAARGLM
jgi:DNA repair protein RadC